MNILVCIKQVPDTTEIKIDPVTNTLIRAGVPSIVNTFDAFALESALRIKDADPGVSVTVVTMGPAQASVALNTCLGAGADNAYLVSDRAFGGSDTLATSYILSNAIRAIEEKQAQKFDLILCGKQAIDGDTAQVGPEIAEQLDYPQITYATELTAEKGKLRVKRETEDGYEIREAALPAVVTVTKTAYDLRFPTIRRLLDAYAAETAVLTAEDFPVDRERAGLGGSPTKVRKTFVPERNKTGMKIEEATGALSAIKLAAQLSADGIL
ncbi:MAG: electron transfer flavoprotein subunit beta/FixA family protein [Clostridiales Family XIII bacterium]|jgi:electron transfer flavoprotein beta subunit|nr:electron transfer flavoprotein subunit beta/FixA family protein [Clostridiales Family XIII bacterium]